MLCNQLYFFLADLAEPGLPMLLFEDYVDCSGIQQASQMLEIIEDRGLLMESRQVVRRVTINIYRFRENLPSLPPRERDWCCCV